MYRTFVIIRHTFIEAIGQTMYSLLLGLGAALIVIFALLPFFTFGEDTIMFKAVCLDIILLLVLIATLFATSKSIYDEIEDRTMLTLMSKPVSRWEVLVGKYIGIILAALLAVVILGVICSLALWYRLPGDYTFAVNSLDENELLKISHYRWMHITGLWCTLFGVWLEICVLASIGVALSTRFSLVVNLPVVIILYMAGNLTRFLFPLSGSDPVKGFAWVLSLLLPYLETFDIRSVTVYRPIAMFDNFASEHDAVKLGAILKYLSISCLYAITYSTFALAAGMLSFRTRELGGGEA